jgi:hypothetical protein
MVFHNLYASPIIRVIKSRVRWAGHVACTGDEKSIQNFGWNLKGYRPLRTIHRWEDNIRMEKWGWNVCTVFMWLRIGTSSRLL